LYSEDGVFNSLRRLQFPSSTSFILFNPLPGIAGIIGVTSSPETDSALQRMLQRLSLDSSCSSTTVVEPLLRTVVAAVHRTGPAPVWTWNAARTVGCLMVGEPFVPESTGDAATALLGHYHNQGIAALANLHGWFSGLLLDLRQRKVVLFNDRHGLGRLYVHEAPGRFAFASEAKALLALDPALKQLDSRGVAEWLSCGCVLQNRTLFSGISLLPAGSAWTFAVGRPVEKRTWFELQSWENQPLLSAAEFEGRLLEVFPRALERSLRGSQPVAMSLTGGLDGRMIMAWARHQPGHLPCYTFNGTYRDCADVRIGRRVARACGQSHQTISLGDEFLKEFPALAEQSVAVSDGAMDVTGAAELYANRFAREIAPVRLTGNYGSEIIRRNVAFRPRSLPTGLFTPEMAQHAAAAARTYAGESRGHRLGFIATRQVPWHHYARFSVEQSQLSVRSPFLDHDLVALCFQAPPESAQALEPTLRAIAAGNPALAKMPTDRGVSWPPPAQAINRLRHRFHDCVAKAEYAYDYGMPDWLARVDRTLSPLHLERLFLGRQKFCHFRTWYRRQLAPFVKDVLLDPRSRSRGYLNGATLEPMVTGHIRGTHNRTTEIHKLLSLELLQRRLLD
jgi:asparagine synthase (glutamine-hydrolysing)